MKEYPKANSIEKQTKREIKRGRKINERQYDKACGGIYRSYIPAQTKSQCGILKMGVPFVPWLRKGASQVIKKVAKYKKNYKKIFCTDFGVRQLEMESIYRGTRNVYTPP